MFAYMTRYIGFMHIAYDKVNKDMRKQIYLNIHQTT